MDSLLFYSNLHEYRAFLVVISYLSVFLELDSQCVYSMLTVENPSFQICERSLTTSTGGPTGPPSSCFVRAEMLPSGYLIRPCEGGVSIINIVDHVDLDVSMREPTNLL